MGRPRTPTAPNDEALATLVGWVHARLEETGMSYTQLARDVAYDRSWVSRSLSGRRLPSWPIVEAVATRCGASHIEARSLWETADAARRERQTRYAEGFPPESLATCPQLCMALRDLIVSRGISQRELVRRDPDGVLARSTIGAVLRLERSLSYETMIQVLRACELGDDAITAWQAHWWQLGAPFRKAMDRRRREIAYAKLKSWGYGRRGCS